MFSIGFELEVSGIPVVFRKPVIIKYNRDASIEREYKIFLRDRRINSFRTGVEINSPIFYNLDDAFDYVDYIYNLLARRGFFYTSQTSFQIHIGLVFNIDRLYKLLKAFRSTEYKWLTLGGLGSANRGFINDFIYERPLSNPLVVRTQLDSGEVLYVNAHNIDYIIKYAKKHRNSKKLSTSNIIYLFGDSSYRRLKYNISRYSIVNFISILQRSTIEIRVFNTPRSNSIAKRVIKFTYNFVKEVVNRDEIDYNNLFDYMLDRSGLRALYEKSEPVKDYMIKKGTLFHRYERGFHDGNYWSRLSERELRKMGLIYEGEVYSPRQSDLREHKYRVYIR